MPRIQHPAFPDVVQDVPADALDAWLEQGWLEAESDAPAKSASKAEWVAYATSKGAVDADKKTKDELIAEYGEA